MVVLVWLLLSEIIPYNKNESSKKQQKTECNTDKQQNELQKNNGEKGGFHCIIG